MEVYLVIGEGNAIRLVRRSTGWFAVYEGPHTQEVIQLFGTVEIPTAYTARATLVQVLPRIQQLNPQVLVYC